MQVVPRTYTASVGQVFSHLGCDREVIHAWATVCDWLKFWPNQDNRDYREEVDQIPEFAWKDGQIAGHTWQHCAWQEAFALEVHSHELRRCKTLEDLSIMYKRLKRVQTFGAVLHSIILKMLWMSSRRNLCKE